MSMIPSSAPRQSSPPEAPAPGRPQESHHRRSRWGLVRLDGLLSEHLRSAPPAELVRHRVLAGTLCLMLLVAVPYITHAVLSRQPLGMLAVSAVTTLGLLGGLVLLRRATSATLPAVFICTIVTLGLSGSALQGRPESITHVSSILGPLFAVYLLGPRRGFFFAAFAGLFMAVLAPLYQLSFGTWPLTFPLEHFWALNIVGGFSILMGWGVIALHSTARDEAQVALQRTLGTLRESEGKLSSLIESTEDMVCSTDSWGRMVTANAAMKQFFLARTGRELLPGQPMLSLIPAEQQGGWKQRFAQVLEGERLRFELEDTSGGSRTTLDISLNPILGEGGRPVGVTFFSHDITARKQAEERLGEMHRTLLDVSRQAGMAEIAIGVLHNVGNTLNSVNISVGLVLDQLRKSRLGGLEKVARLLQEHSTDLATFFTTQSQGQKLPGYVLMLSGQLQQERETVLEEMYALSSNVEHLKSIVSMQQKYARTAGAVEQLSVPQLIDEALRLHSVSFEREGITIERDYAEVPRLVVDRHKLLQILVNLLSNARHALKASGRADKRLRLRVLRAPEPGHLLLEVADNGMGIAPEHLPRMFSQGFTTRKDGHGFGLHISALTAGDMGGQLSCSSPGPGHGATFTLRLPLEPPDPGSGDHAAK
jgi:PAS domain S-box-containing protein